MTDTSSSPVASRREAPPPASSFKLHCGRLLAAFSLCAFLVLSFAFVKKADITAIVSTVPTWIWASALSLPSILAWVFFKSRFGLVVFFLWAAFGISTMDSLPALSRTGMSQYKLTLHPDLNAWRAVTLDCQDMDSLPIAALARLNPDIIFLQGAVNPTQTMETAWSLFGESARVCQIGDCAVICDSGDLSHAAGIPNMDGLVVDWFPARSTLPVRLVNVKLLQKQGDRSIFSVSDWRYFSNLRNTHRLQIGSLLATLQERGSHVANMPIIMAGNFNAAPNSSSFSLLSDDFIDSYQEKGTGFGSTTPASFPLLRHNRVLTTPPLLPVRSGVVDIPGACHRAVVCDIAKS